MYNNRQIDPGTYDLWQGPYKVGVCFVQPGPLLDTTIEHWVLFPGFVSPSFNAQVGAVDDLVLRGVSWQGLAPNAAQTRPAGILGAGDFLAIMHAFASSVGGNFRYVRSACESKDGVPPG